jgi:hypothetical protein
MNDSIRHFEENHPLKDIHIFLNHVETYFMNVLGDAVFIVQYDENLDFSDFTNKMNRHAKDSNIFFHSTLALTTLESFVVSKDLNQVEKLVKIFEHRFEVINSLFQETHDILNEYYRFSLNYLNFQYSIFKAFVDRFKFLSSDGLESKEKFENKNESNQTEPTYPETEIKIEFNPTIFKDEYSSRLFCFLIDRYHNGVDKELSNIYQWMENKGFIHLNKRQEYKALVIKHNITKKKYSRVHSSNEYESTNLDHTFNDLQRKFNSLLES